MIRVGQGCDIHALVPGRRMILGGVDIAHHSGLLGHSDADALLGAAALGDIGRHFPDTDARYRGADSRQLLRATVELLAAAGWRVGNVDATIIAQQPKMAPYLPQMVANIAADLQVPAGCVNIKAKTAERLGFVGRAEGVATEAVVLISREPVEDRGDTRR